MFPSMRVVHTRPCIALRGAVTMRAPVRRPQTSARARQRRFLGRSKFSVFQLCAQQRHGVASALAACNALNLLRTPRQRPNRGSSPALFLTSTSSNRAPKQCQSLCNPMPPPSTRRPSGTTHADSRHFGFPALRIFAVSDFQHLPAHQKPVHRKPTDRKT